MKRIQIIALLSAVLLLCLMSCSAEESVSDNPYEQEFEDARQRATTDFERDVLEDSVITAAEYSEAQQRYVSCVREKGLEAEISYDEFGNFDGYIIGRVEYSEEEMNDYTATCLRGTTTEIEPLYTQINVNPNKEDIDELTVQCLVRKGIAPKGFTASDLRELLNDGSSVVAGAGEILAPGEVVDVPVREGAENPLTIPGGGDLNSAEAIACLTNPQS